MMTRVVAAILEENSRILICRRRPDQPHPLKWEFPGGKIESGETPDQAAVRELPEELGIPVSGVEENTRYEYSYPGKAPILLIFLRVIAYTGIPQNLIFHEMRWEARERLAAYDFLEGDRPFLADTGFMETAIRMVEPGQNEFLAQLESKNNKPNHFFRAMANR